MSKDGEQAEYEGIIRCTAEQHWRCKANISTGAGTPQDCGWPLCGCDPHAEKVIEALNESNFAIVPACDPPDEMVEAGRIEVESPYRGESSFRLSFDDAKNVYEAMVERSQKP